MKFRTLLAMMAKFAEDHPDHEALDEHVVVRVQTRDTDDADGDLHVGGLRKVTVDAGCTDEFALVFDADQEPDEEDPEEEADELEIEGEDDEDEVPPDPSTVV